MNKITYANKVDTRTTTDPEINKVTASTLNEVKTIVNETVDEVLSNINDISTNATDISTNVTNISTNATDIGQTVKITGNQIIAGIKAFTDDVTATTQANAINNTTVATTAYVKNLIGEIPAGLSFESTWNADTDTPDLSTATPNNGQFWIVSVNGATDLSGITDWKTGDWAIYVVNGAGANGWQKVDNSSVLDGQGTGQKVALWSGSGDSNTLTNSPITVSGNDATFTGTTTVQGTGDSSFSGNVGVGTTTPGKKLDVRNGTITVRDETNTNYIELDRFEGITMKGNGSGAKYISTPNTDDLGFKTNNVEQMRIDSDGNVGIGTDSPDAKLEVSGDNGTAIRITIPQSSPVVGDVLSSFETFSNDTSGSIIPSVRTSISTIAEDIYARKVGLTLNTSGADGENLERVRVDGLGNVGIGTDTPSAKLDVSGVTKTDSILINATSPIASSIVTLNKASTSTGTDVGQFYDITKENTTDSAASLTYGVVNRVDNISNFENGSIISVNNVARVTGTGDVENVYPCLNESSIKGTGTIDYAIGSFNKALLSNASGTVNNLFGTHTKVDLTAGTAGEITLLSFDFDQSAGTTITGDFQYINIKNEQPIASSIGGTARALNIESELPSFFAGSIGIGTAVPTQAKLVVSGNVAFNEGDETMGQINPEFERLDFKVEDGVVNTTPVAMTLRNYPNGARLGIGTTTPKSKLQVDGGIQMADDTDTASSDKVGTLKYRILGNNSYVDMCMQTGAATYAWVNIVQNNW
tara:strand:- start:96 stop:2369 length:2274 start_codon:yes stop_codon:yes gene_type:complete